MTTPSKVRMDNAGKNSNKIANILLRKTQVLKDQSRI